MCVPGCMDAVHASLSRRGFFKGATAMGFAVTALSSAEAATKKKSKEKEKNDAAPERPERYFKAVVDLTHTMSPEFPTFFGVPGIELQKQYEFKKDGFNLNMVADHRACRHASRCADPLLRERITVEKIVAGELVVPLAVIDVRKPPRRIPTT